MISKEKARDIVRSTIGYFVVAVVCVVYVAGSLLVFVEGDRDVWQVMLDGLIVFFMGIFTNRAFELQGMLNGEENEKVKATHRLHAETVVRIAPQMDRLDEWCSLKNSEALKFERIKILAGQGMAYKNFFQEDGTAIDFAAVEPEKTDKKSKRQRKKKYRCYLKAINVNITPLSSGALTSDGGRHGDPFYLGRTKAQYETLSGAKDVAVKIIASVLFGYYGVEPLLNLNYGELIWRLWHVCLFVLMGVIKMNSAYMFITDEYRGRAVKKINYLEMFEKWAKKDKTPEEREEKNDGNVCDKPD